MALSGVNSTRPAPLGSDSIPITAARQTAAAQVGSRRSTAAPSTGSGGATVRRAPAPRAAAPPAPPRPKARIGVRRTSPRTTTGIARRPRNPSRSTFVEETVSCRLNCRSEVLMGCPFWHGPEWPTTPQGATEGRTRARIAERVSLFFAILQLLDEPETKLSKVPGCLSPLRTVVSGRVSLNGKVTGSGSTWPSGGYRCDHERAFGATVDRLAGAW